MYESGSLSEEGKDSVKDALLDSLLQCDETTRKDLLEILGSGHFREQELQFVDLVRKLEETGGKFNLGKNFKDLVLGSFNSIVCTILDMACDLVIRILPIKLSCL